MRLSSAHLSAPFSQVPPPPYARVWEVNLTKTHYVWNSPTIEKSITLKTSVSVIGLLSRGCAGKKACYTMCLSVFFWFHLLCAEHYFLEYMCSEFEHYTTAFLHLIVGIGYFPKAVEMAATLLVLSVKNPPLFPARQAPSLPGLMLGGCLLLLTGRKSNVLTTECSTGQTCGPLTLAI